MIEVKNTVLCMQCCFASLCVDLFHCVHIEHLAISWLMDIGWTVLVFLMATLGKVFILKENLD